MVPDVLCVQGTFQGTWGFGASGAWGSSGLGSSVQLWTVSASREFLSETP